MAAVALFFLGVLREAMSAFAQAGKRSSVERDGNAIGGQ
jgi:hypothetical protein